MDIGSGSGGGGNGDSLLDVSAISGIAGEDNDYNDSELFRASSRFAAGAGAGSGGGAAGRYSLSADLDSSIILGGRSPRRQSHAEQTGTSAAAVVDAALMSPPPFVARGGAEDGPALNPPGRTRLLNRGEVWDGGGGGGSGGAADLGATGTLGEDGGGAGAWDARLDESRGTLRSASVIPVVAGDGAGL